MAHHGDASRTPYSSGRISRCASSCPGLPRLLRESSEVDAMNKEPAQQRQKSTVIAGDIRRVWTILGIIVLAASSSSSSSSSAGARAIKVVQATYGRNCGAPAGNATVDFARQCEGRETCWYVLDKVFTGDPAVGCRKDFHAEWLCTDTEFHTATLSPAAGAGSTLVLSCVEQNGAGR